MNQLKEQTSLKTKCGSTIKVDKDGSLGLLALGDVGIQLWRNAKLAHHNTSKTSHNTLDTSIPKSTIS